MNYANFVGSSIQPDKRFGTFTEVSLGHIGMVPAEPLSVDPYLPGVVIDAYDPAGAVAIEPGRFVSIGYCEAVGSGTNPYRFGRTETGYAPLTLHDGKNLTPVGMSTHKIYRNHTQRMTNSAVAGSDVSFRRGFIAEVPFVLAVNNSYGNLDAGDYLTGYGGSTTSTSVVAWIHRGKPVKWQKNTLNVKQQSASTTVNLDSAIFPYIMPTLVFAENAGTAVALTGATLAFDGTKWVATLTAAATRVWYSVGQSQDQIAGEALRIQPLKDILNENQLMKWVEITPKDWANLPPLYRPATQRVRTTEAIQEVPTTVTAGSLYRTLNGFISLHDPIIVEILGTVTDADGIQTTYSGTDWFQLPNVTNQASNMGSYLLGQYHAINWRTGLIEIAGNVSVTSIRVTYSYDADPRNGAVLWGQGVENISDGRYVNDPDLNGLNKIGIPGHLNYADVVAAMRIVVK